MEYSQVRDKYQNNWSLKEIANKLKTSQLKFMDSFMNLYHINSISYAIYAIASLKFC